jgi:ABC-type multidrug transport system permease subunit
MLELLIFILSTIGLTLIITTSFIFKKIRDNAKKINPMFGKLLSCSQCVGFYIAILIQFIILIHNRMSLSFNWFDLYYILYGFIGSFICYVVYLLLKPLIDKYD